MAQRFNAPPGWHVPPNFVPTSDWRPDPSWPPAPQGWSFWVDDGAPPANDTSLSFDPTSPAAQHDAPYGVAPATPAPQGVPYGSAPAAPVGAYGSTAPGSAQGALAEAQIAAAKKARQGGIIAILIGVVLTVVLVVAFDRMTIWGPVLVIAGIVGIIKGSIDLGKARKAAAGPAGYGPGVTPPGQNPPGTF